MSLDAVNPRRWGWDRWALVALLLLAWALRLVPILDNRFHPDEALYGYWGLLIGRGRDPWLATVPVYKPPLLPYLAAGAQALFGISGGNSEFAARLLGLAAGLLMVPLTAALARSLYRDRWTAAAAVAVGVALSPLAIFFSATVFLDPLMVTLGLAACVAAARGRPGWAGLLAGLAFATKQTGLVWVPLVVIIQISNIKHQISSLKSQTPGLSSMLSVICYLSSVILLVFAWDAVRVARGAQSFWRMGITGYGGLRLVWPQELWPRLREWVGLMRYLFVSPVVNGALLVWVSVLAWKGIKRPKSEVRGPRLTVQSPNLGRHTRGSFADLLLISFCLVYFLLHWLWAFPMWDRYLLPLVPVLAILLGRLFARVTHRLQPAIGHRSLFIVHCSLFILLILPAFNAAHSRYPIGGDPGAYDGIDEVTAFLSNLPEGSVVYQHWLGWQYEYYLFDAPVYLAYWPTPAWLAHDARTFGEGDPRYITFPSWESTARVEWALAEVGYGLTPVLTTTRRDGTLSFTVYRVENTDSRTSTDGR